MKNAIVAITGWVVCGVVAYLTYLMDPTDFDAETEEEFLRILDINAW